MSSPSGGGKTTIARHLLAGREDVTYSVSATTRPIREGEVSGEHYQFLARPEFERRVADGEFLEWAEYGGQLYGTLRSVVTNGLETGRHVVLDIEVQGAKQLRDQFPNSVHVFVLPPSAAVLIERLRNRRTEDEASLARRITIAAQELASTDQYDYLVVNGDIEDAVAQVAAILEVESRRPRRLKNLNLVINKLRRDLAGAAAPSESTGAA